MTRSTIAAIGATLIATLAMVTNSDAAVFSYMFESFDTTVTASGTLDATNQGGGVYLVTGMTGSVFGSGVSPSPDPITVVAPLNPPGFTTDNLLYPASDPTLDVYGIGFYTASGLDWNVWGNSPGNYTLYAYDSFNYVVTQGGDFSVTAIPEASTWALMLLGFAGLSFAGYRNARIKPVFAA